MVSTVGYTTGDTAVLAVLKKVGVIFCFWKNFTLFAEKNYTPQSTGAYGCVTVLQKHGSTKGMSPIGSPCVFPFIYKDQTWKQCISDGSGSSLHWCSTQVYFSSSIRCSKIESTEQISHFSFPRPLFFFTIV